MFDVREYASADEMIQAYRERRERISRPMNARADTAIDLRSRPSPKAKPDGWPMPEEPKKSVGKLWTTPSFTEVPQCVEAPIGAWRREINGAVFVLVDGVVHYCAPASTHFTAISGGSVDNGCIEPPNMPDGSIPRTNKDLLRAVAHKHGMSVREMLADRRLDKVVRARQEAMWLLKKLTTYSLPYIGNIMGGFDHTTILHGVRRHQARVDAGEA